MCLAIPARLVELLPGEQVVVNLGGIRKTVSIGQAWVVAQQLPPINGTSVTQTKSGLLA